MLFWIDSWVESLIFCLFLYFLRKTTRAYCYYYFSLNIHVTQGKNPKSITDLTCRTTTTPSVRASGTVRACITSCPVCWTIILFPGSGPSVRDTMSPNFSSESDSLIGKWLGYKRCAGKHSGKRSLLIDSWPPLGTIRNAMSGFVRWPRWFAFLFIQRHSSWDL